MRTFTVSRHSSFSSFKCLNRRAGRMVAVAAIAGIGIAGGSTAMAVSTWTGPGGTTASPTSGNWNNAADWSPTGVPASSATTELDFLGSTTYTSTDDISGAFSFNILKLNGNGSSIAANAGNTLVFNGTNPTVNQLGTGIFNITAPIFAAASTNINQVNGGEIDFSGALTSGGTTSLNLSNSSGTGNSTVKFTGANAFGGLTVNSHVTAIAGLSPSTSTLGTGTVTLAGGTLQLQGQQLTGTTATQQIISLQNSSFTRDIVFENTSSGSMVSAGGVDGGSSLYETGFKGGPPGLPTTASGRIFQSVASAPQGNTTALSTKPSFQLQPYNGNNALLVTNAASTLSLTAPTTFNRIEFLYTGSLAGNIPVTVSFNFADGNTSTGTYTFTPQDWYSTHSSTAIFGQSTNGTNLQNYSGNLTEVDFALSGTDATQAISSLVFIPSASLGTSPKGMDVMALSGAAFSTGLASSQTYGNNLAVTADSSINIDNSLTASMGNLTIGSNKLSITSSNTSNTAYSLTLGTVTLTGSGTASFDVSNSTGGGAGTLYLGALNDGGSARTITFNPSGSGSIILGTDATSLVAGTAINIQHGTLYSNSNASIGTFATVTLSGPGTLSLAGATQQQISALNGSGGTVNFVTSAVNGTNTTLTVGNSDNLSSTYGGAITGSGILAKSGMGTMTLSGASSFAGGANVNSNGSFIATSTIITSGGGTIIAAGPSVVSNFGNISTGPLGTAAVLINSGATGTASALYLDNTPGRVLANPVVIGSSGPAVPTIGGLNSAGVTTFSGNVTLGSGSTGDYGHSLTIGATNGGEVDFTGSILANAMNGHSDITINNLSGTGNATVKFTGNNTYAGGTTVNPNVTLIAGPSTSTSPFGTNTVKLAGGTVALRGVLQNTQQPIALTGFNADTIVDAAASSGTSSSTGTTTSTIDGGNLFYQIGYQGSTANGLPATGLVTSATTGHQFQLGSYTDNNTLRFTSAGAGQTLTLGTPANFQSLNFLATSNKSATYSVTLNFADSSTDTIGSFSTADWYNGQAGYNAVTGLNPVARASGTIQDFGGALTMQEYDATVPVADQSKTLNSVTITPTYLGGSSADVYAISGATTASTTPLASQTLVNNFNVTANSGIDVSGSLAATIGTLTVGSQQLSITSADTTTNPYSLTTGTVTFVGQTPTFSVANSAGGGAGTLVLGSLNDNGAKQTVTKTGAGTLALSSPATVVTDGSLYNIAGGTLASNDANALTYVDGNGHLNLVGITVANGATFSIGATQAIDNLNDYGTPVVNGATVALNGYNLSIGSVHDRNSTFSGRITDGSGTGSGLVKNGGGTLTLAGSSTYTGATAVNFGTLLVANTTGSATGSGNVTLNQSTLASGTTGTIGGNVLSGNTYYTIAPGGIGSIGTLNVGGLTTSFFTTLNFDLGTGSGIVTNGDLLNLGSGTVNIPNGTVITLGSNPSTSGTDYRLIGGSISGINLSHFTLPTPPSGISYSLSTTVDPGFIDLVVGSGSVNLIWNNSLSNTTPPGDGVTWANYTGAPGDTSQNFLANGTPSGFTTGNAVTFNDNNNGHYNVNIASNVLPSSVTVTTSGNYAFGSTGGFAIGDAPSGPTPLTVSGGGSLTISNVNTFTGPTGVSGTGTSLHVTASGTLATTSLNVGSGATAAVDGLLTNTPAVTANGTINFGAADLVNYYNDPLGGFLVRTLGSFTVASGGAVNISAAAGTSTRTVLISSSLTNSGRIDIANNDMIVHGGNLGSVATAGSIPNQIAAGYNNGLWTGTTGIASSTAASGRLTAVGYAPGGTTFDGMSTAGSDVLVKYTYYGDANLDGKVDGSDYSRIDSGYLTQATGWYNGDFNYDGVINGSDYTLIDNAFNTQGASLAAAVSAQPTAQIGGSAAVPEPTTLSLLSLATVGLLSRRRKSQRICR